MADTLKVKRAGMLSEAVMHLNRADAALEMGAVEQAQIDIGRAKAAIIAADCEACLRCDEHD